MRHSISLGFCLALAAPLPAFAAPTLLATGTLGGTSDLSGLSGTLENGLPENILGGLGSGLAYAGGGTFIGLPDRGPNATPFNAMIDDTVSYISRFQTMNMALTANAPGSSLPFSLTPTLTGTTLLFSPSPLNYGTGAGLGTKIDGITPIGSGAPASNDASHYYFSGRSDNFGAGSSLNPDNARLDPESIRVSNDGKSVFISDEYGPYVRQFDRASGALVKTFTLPDNLGIATISAQKDIEIAGNAAGRTTNKGMEGLAITPDGKTLVGIMQAALLQDNDSSAHKKLLRIVTIDIATGETHEFAYKLTDGSGVSDIVALNDHQFLVDERDGKGLGDGTAAAIKKMYLIDISGATDITGMDAADALTHVVSKEVSPFIDLVSALTGIGVDPTDIPSKIEGLAFGEDVDVDGILTHTLWISDDNDFLPDTSGPNHFYVFGFTDGDLPSGYRYTAQAFNASVPEPSSWALMIGGFAFVGARLRRRKLAVRFA